MRDRSEDYAKLAVHLNPTDLDDGVRSVDTAILALQRALYRPRNLARLCRHLGFAFLLLSEFILVLHGYIWFDPITFEPFFGFIQRVSIWLALPLALLSIHLIFFLSSRIYDRDEMIPEPPPAIAKWLREHGCKYGLRYWHELYWPWHKKRTHRREFFGYVFWRKAPLGPPVR